MTSAPKKSPLTHDDEFFLNKIKPSYERGRKDIQNRFETSRARKGAGPATAAALSKLADATLKKLARHVLGHRPPDSQPAVLAVGGYGRGEMAPFSDMDILFLLPDRSATHDRAVERILKMLWALNIKTGHAVRSIDECLELAAKDVTVATGLFENRLISGNRHLFKKFRERFLKEIQSPEFSSFVAAKLKERDARHKKMGDSRYRLEPNIKEGKGGLRDLQTLYWISRFLCGAETAGKMVRQGFMTEAESRALDVAHDFLWTLRCHLHYLCGRSEDRLTFDIQPDMARRLGYADRAGQKGAERFMKHYFLIARNVGDLTRTLCTALEEAGSSGGATRGKQLILPPGDIQPFILTQGRLNIPSPAYLKNNPESMITIFHRAKTTGLDIHATAIRGIRSNLKRLSGKTLLDPDANRLFIDILTFRPGIARTLRQMNESGVLGAFIPDFGRIVAHMQYDMYHTYTADEHTLQAIAMLEQLESGELRRTAALACDLFPKIRSRKALYVAMLLHDIAKGRGGKHQAAGEKIARHLGPRLGLNAEETDTAAWLVGQHLSMSEFSSRRDIDDEKTIDDFAAVIRSPERLRLLTILTTADIMAVGDGRWTGWKATVIESLFSRTMERLVGNPKTRNDTQRIDTIREEAKALLPGEAEKLENLSERVTPYYWLSIPPQTIAWHAQILHENPLPLVHAVQDTDQEITEVTVAAGDRKGLFALLSGAISAAGGSIVQARIFTLKDGTALDIFHVQGGGGGPYEDKARLIRSIRAALDGKLDIERELDGRKRPQHNRMRHVSVPPRVLIDNDASTTCTVIEINGKDRPGLVYRLAGALTGLGLQISAAKIATFGSVAVDVFYVKDGFGLKILTPSAETRIENALLEILNQ